MIRVLLLYLLTEEGQSAYDLKRILSRSSMRFWFPVEDPSIYSGLRTLLGLGYIREDKANARKSRAKRYTITKAGLEYLERLTQESWRGPVEPVLSKFEAALATSGDMMRSELRVELDHRLMSVERRIAELRAVERGAISPLLARREEKLLEAERSWLQEELNRLSGD